MRVGEEVLGHPVSKASGAVLPSWVELENWAVLEKRVTTETRRARSFTEKKRKVSQ